MYCRLKVESTLSGRVLSFLIPPFSIYFTLFANESININASLL